MPDQGRVAFISQRLCTSGFKVVAGCGPGSPRKERWHEVIDGMLEKGWGRIISISWVNGPKGQFGQTNYSTAKAGIHGFTMALAQELAARGVTVNTVSPGYIATGADFSLNGGLHMSRVAAAASLG